jgi:diadenosine tetraphosphate (Ap4A) HIT family hydrolase
MSAREGDGTCPLCTGNRKAAEGEAERRECLALTEGWRVVVHRSGLPGWLLVVARRHVTSLADLTDTEVAELGPLLRAGAQAQREVVDAEWSYVMEFSEGMNHHLHFSLVPRRTDLPEDRRGAKVGAYNAGDDVIDDARRDDLAMRFSQVWPAS